MENRLLDTEGLNDGGWYNADENMHLYYFTHDIATCRTVIDPEFHQEYQVSGDSSARGEPEVQLHPEDMARLRRIRDQICSKSTRRFCCKLRLRTLRDIYRAYPCIGAFQADDRNALNRVAGYIIGLNHYWHLQSQAMQLEKAVNLADMAAGVIHDTKNQLAIVRSALAPLRDAGMSPQCARYLDIARQSTDDAVETLQRILDYTRNESSSFKEFDLREFMDHCAPSIYPLFNARYEMVFRNCDESCAIRGDPVAIRNMLVNLSINARDAMPRGGAVTFTVYRAGYNPDWQGPPDRSWVCVSVRDTGTGMTPEVIRRAFEPLFTTKPARQGTGLGLWICRSTMISHEGTISVRSVPGEGTEIVLAFPRCPDDRSANESLPMDGRGFTAQSEE